MALSARPKHAALGAHRCCIEGSVLDFKCHCMGIHFGLPWHYIFSPNSLIVTFNGTSLVWDSNGTTFLS